MTDTRFTAAVLIAQVLVQIGAFTLPALLPGYIARWSLSATEAGWLIGTFFAAYVVAVPVLVGLTDRLPARRIYLVGAGATALSHLGFAVLADGFWSGLVLRAIGGVGWAGCYMPGLKAIADRLEGTAQSRAVTWHVRPASASPAPPPSPWPVRSMRSPARLPPSCSPLPRPQPPSPSALSSCRTSRWHARRRVHRSTSGRCSGTGRRWRGSPATRCTPGRWRRCGPGGDLPRGRHRAAWRIPFAVVAGDAWVTARPFERALLCQSPKFTPHASDNLISVFCEYIDFR